MINNIEAAIAINYQSNYRNKTFIWTFSSPASSITKYPHKIERHGYRNLSPFRKVTVAELLSNFNWKRQCLASALRLSRLSASTEGRAGERGNVKLLAYPRRSSSTERRAQRKEISGRLASKFITPDWQVNSQSITSSAQLYTSGQL